MKRVLVVLLLSFIVIGIIGCGGGEPTKFNVNIKEKGSNVGVLLDSKVIGAYYETNSEITGKTNQDGEYYYEDGDIINFYVGNIKLGQAKGSQLTTVFDFDDPAKVAVLLQSLDLDGNPNNGIDISEEDFEKMRHSTFTLNEVDPDSSSFREKFKTVMGYEIEVDSVKAEDHALKSLKEELIRKYDQDIPLYLNEKATINGLIAADYTTNSVFGYNPNDYLHTYESRMRSYFFIKYALEFLKDDIEVHQYVIDRSELSQEIVDKKAEKVIGMFTGLYGLYGLSKGTMENLKDLKKLKKTIPSFGTYATKAHDKEMIKFIGLKVGKDIVGKQIYESLLSQKSVAGRMLKDCTPMGKPNVTDLLQCLSRSVGELGKAGSHIYGISTQIVSVRKRNAAILAIQYLELYYAFDKRSKILSNIFTSLSSSVGENYNFTNYDQNDDSQLDRVLNIISKKEFNKKYLFAAGWQYNFDEAKELINKYQSTVEGLTSDFMNNFDLDTINTIDQNYVDISLRLEPTFYDNYKVCLDITNQSSFTLKSPDGRVKYFLDDQEIGSDSFVLDDLSSTINPYIERCTAEINLAPEQLLTSKILRVEYDLNYLPMRMDTSFKKQNGVQYFEISKKSLTNALAKPVIKSDIYIAAWSGDDVTLDASESYSANGDYLTYKWEYIPRSEPIANLVPHIQDSSASKTTFKAPILPLDKVRYKLHFKLTVTASNGQKSEKFFSVVVLKEKGDIKDPNDKPSKNQIKDGIWTGNKSFSGSTNSWTATLHVDNINNSYLIDYPTFQCGGYLELLSTDDSGVSLFKEHLTYGASKCGSDKVEVSMQNDNRLSFVAKDGDTVKASIALDYDTVDEKDKNVVTTRNIMWQDNKEAETTIVDWDSANAYCSRLSLASYNDWRLPTWQEYEDHITEDNHLTIFEHYIHTTISYYSSTEDEENSNNVWGAMLFIFAKNSISKSPGNYAVRCVRDTDGTTNQDPKIDEPQNIKPVISNLELEIVENNKLKMTTHYDANNDTAIDYIYWKVTSPSGEIHEHSFNTVVNHTNGSASRTMPYDTNDVFDIDGMYTVESYVINENGVKSDIYTKNIYIDKPDIIKSINNKRFAQKDDWRAFIVVDTLVQNQKSATINFRELSCGGDLTYLQEQNDGYLFDEEITFGNCMQNCQVWIKSDGSYYEETCNGNTVGGDLEIVNYY